MNYTHKYLKYKTKYSKLKNKLVSLSKSNIPNEINNNIIQDGGNKKFNIIILHHPTIFDKPIIPKHLENITNKLKKFGKLYNYFFKFSYYKNKFDLSDIEFDNAADDIYNNFKHLNKIIIVAINHASPYGLYFANKYSQYCKAIICYPFRFYNITSYERRIWKMKHNNGFEKFVKNKKYNVDDYVLNINQKRFSKLFDNIGDDERSFHFFALDFYLQKNSHLIPTIFKIPTYLYTRLNFRCRKYN